MVSFESQATDAKQQNVIHNNMTYVIHKDKKKIIEVLEWVEINGKMHPKSKKTTYFKSEDKPDFGQKN